LRGGEAHENAEALLRVLSGKIGALRDVALLNASAALVVAGRAKQLKEAVAMAEDSINSGAAKRCLERLVAVSTACSSAAQ